MTQEKLDELEKRVEKLENKTMNKTQKVKNIMAFLSIIFGESNIWNETIMNFTPDYLIEKFERYVLSTSPESDWGLHPSLRRNIFEPYCIKHNLPWKQYEEIE